MWPQFSTIEPIIQNKIRNASIQDLSKKVCWIRVISGANNGLVMHSNKDWEIFKAMGEADIYGDITRSGTVGVDLKGKPIFAQDDINVMKPSPVIQALSVKEGKDQISRHAELRIKVFSLGQLELVQEYLMEPGFTLLIEYGWNSVSALSRLVKTDDKFVNNAAGYNLNQDLLHERRLASGGDYDSFLGFIVGGNVSANEDESFDVTIKLRGAPGLPTYLQAHNNIKKESKGKVSMSQSHPPFSVADLTATNEGAVVMRLKYMYNSLPTTRQTWDVVNNVLRKASYSHIDFIGFDKRFEDSITNEVDNDGVSHGSLKIPKEKLYSSQKYIRFKLAVDILNANTSINSIVIGSKKVDVKIDIDDCVIGAFPNMFSTKKEKLLIPGYIPDFSKYFLSEEGSIDLSAAPPIDNRIVYERKTDDAGNITNAENQIIEFVSQKNLEETTAKDKEGKDKVDKVSKQKIKRGFKEKAGYYGYLKNLYINFNVLYKELDSKNKTMRQVLESLLNEMSSAVNSFWKFQIVESTHDQIVDGKVVDSYIKYTIIDENWVGANTSEPAVFYHNGDASRFLQANLSLDIPGQMTSQIVLKRMSLASNPDAPEVKLGGIFTDKRDMFLRGYVNRDNKLDSEQVVQKEETPEQLEARRKEQERLNGIRYVDTKYAGKLKLEMEMDVYGKKNYSRFTSSEDSWASESIRTEAKGVEDAQMKLMDQEAILYGKKKDIYFLKNTPEDQLTAEQKEAKNNIKKLEKEVDTLNKELDKERVSVKQKEEEVLKKNEEQKQANITTNLDKIDIVINPEQLVLNESQIKTITNKDTFRDNFRIYCCDDSELFDTMKRNCFNGEGEGTTGRYSHPLPIKYEFVVSGVSGIRRGDTFNIIGIPKKYKDRGLFQVTQVDHEISDMSWKTSVLGEFRQLQ